MKRIVLAVSSLILILAIVQLQFTDSAIANPSIPPEIPVIVTVPEMRINATITIINGEGYAKVDSAYQTTTVYKFGDAYNDGHIKIAYDRMMPTTRYLSTVEISQYRWMDKRLTGHTEARAFLTYLVSTCQI